MNLPGSKEVNPVRETNKFVTQTTWQGLYSLEIRYIYCPSHSFGFTVSKLTRPFQSYDP